MMNTKTTIQIPSPKGNEIMFLHMTPKKKIGRGRPKKIPSTTTIDQQENPNIITNQKRGRGRPRKYPPNPQLKDFPTKLGQIPDLAGSMKSPRMASVWGTAQKGKRVNLKRKEKSKDLGFPSAKESASPSSMESTSYSNSNSNSNSNSKSQYSWFSDIVIPGPIPNLDELLKDQSIFRHSDFFSDIPDDWASSSN